MPFRSITAVALALILCGGSSGCVFEYQGSVVCERCDETTFGYTTPWLCSQQDAIDAARAACGEAAANPVDVESRLVYARASDCGNLRPVPPSGVISHTYEQALRRTGLASKPPAIEVSDGPSCPAPSVDLKVTVFQDVPVTECPGVMGVEVSYQKYISAGVFQPTTLTANVPVGGHHEFLCLDASVAEDDNVGTISVRVYSDLNCVGEMQLAIGQAYSQIPADGSSLEVRANLVTLQYDDEIVPPPAPLADRSNPRHELIPVPDPRFTARRR